MLKEHCARRKWFYASLDAGAPMEEQVIEPRPSTFIQTDNLAVDDRPAITRRSQFFAEFSE